MNSKNTTAPAFIIYLEFSFNSTVSNTIQVKTFYLNLESSSSKILGVLHIAWCCLPFGPFNLEEMVRI